MESFRCSFRCCFHGQPINPIQRLIFRLDKIPAITHVFNTGIRSNTCFFLFKGQPKEPFHYILNTMQNIRGFLSLVDFDSGTTSFKGYL
ncbi:hypothetical protein CFP56_032242 [Quercus suber]|uniref:Uncharacterized protein n=1 Tax=Quercus suber TaxID=58331 RepID=A0AAW0LV13_QUESU